MKSIWIGLSALMLAMMACSFGGYNVNIQRTNGSGNMVTEQREVSGFDKVRLEGIGSMVIEQGDAESLTIEADDNILPLITTEVSSGKLIIGFKKGVFPQNIHTIRYRLVVKDLTELDLSGLGDIDLTGLTTDQLQINISGGGSVNVRDLSAQSLDADLSGLGSLTSSGEVEEQRVTISGGGSFAGERLKSKTADVNISGLGSAELWVTDALDVNISGGGDVNYYGNPRVSQNVTGLGNVNSKGSK